MHGHEAELLNTTLLMLSAIGCGLILKFVRQPPLVGYILAGLFIGPCGQPYKFAQTDIERHATAAIAVDRDFLCVDWPNG